MNDPVMDRPNHPWDDPDSDGHNCRGCPTESMWKCDEAAHPASPAAEDTPGQPADRKEDKR